MKRLPQPRVKPLRPWAPNIRFLRPGQVHGLIKPVVDGDFLPTNPVTETGFAEAGRKVPLLIGTN